MGDRDVPFDEFAVCDNCGKIGAFDFMGDFYCKECIETGEVSFDEEDNPNLLDGKYKEEK